jgi:parallel beta-helix repeat protein
MKLFQRIFFMASCVLLSTASAVGGQGAGRALYTVPNMGFIEQPTGETVITINDTSGSISSLQAQIDTARSANPGTVIVIHLLRGAIYNVSRAGLSLSSHESLVAEGAIIQAANSSITVPLITIASGSTNVSVSGGTLDGQNAGIQGIFAPAAARANIDKVALKNFASDAISLSGNGNSVFDNEMTVTRVHVSFSSVGIHIQNATQTTLLDNNCHDNGTGILVSAGWAIIANNTCHNNTTGIDIVGGDDDVVANNTCDDNNTGIQAGGTKNMIVSNSLGGNTTAGILSSGTSNNFIDNLFADGNAANFISNGTADNIIAYKSPISATGENYFYPPLIDDQHTNPTIVNGMGRTDLTIASTTIDDVQNQYNAARSPNPNNVIVLHLNGTFTVGASPLLLSSNTSVLLNGTIQINSSTTTSAAVTASGSGQTRISISGGTIDGGNLTLHNALSFTSASMVQIDHMTLQNFGPSLPRVDNSDVIHLTGGSTPYVVTRNTINGGAARGIWLQLSGQKSLISDNEVTNVNEDGVDCDSSTFGAVVKFNYCHDLVRYGVFIEQSANHNLALGNICNHDLRDINVFNNSATPRQPTQLNSIIANSLLGNNGIRNGAGSGATVVTSHNFFFNNTVLNASIVSQQNGTQNYYSQNYLSGQSLSTSGAEVFFNSADVSGNLQLLDSNSGLGLVVQDASSTSGTAIVTAQPSPLGNGSNNDEWQFVPVANGYYRIVNASSGLVIAVDGASLLSGADIVQSPYTAGSTNHGEWLLQSNDNGLYTLVNHLSSLNLEVPGASTMPGTQLDQASPNAGANQLFSLVEDAPVPIPTMDLSGQPATTVIYGTVSAVNVSVSGAQGLGTGTINYQIDGGASTVLALSSGTTSISAGVLPVGLHTVSVTYNGSIFYDSATQTITLTVNPAPLSVSVNSGTRQYGLPDPAFTGTIVGIVNNDAVTAAYSSTDTATSPVGTYPITAALSGSALNNYIITINPGTLTITPAPLIVNIQSATRLYGSANPVFQATFTGLLNGDTVALNGSTPATIVADVGNYPIAGVIAGAAAINYNPIFSNGTLTITPAALVVSPVNATRGYGMPNPVLTGAINGLLNNDPLAAIFSTVATPSSMVGFYPIVASVTGPANKLADYTISSQPGVLTITPAPLVITANDQTKVLHALNPDFSVSYNGFLVGDTPAQLGGTLTCSTTATRPSPAGSYPITCSGQTSINYAITDVPGTLQVLYFVGACPIRDRDDDRPKFLSHSILPPIDADGSSVFHRAGEVPVRFRVCDANGNSIGSPGVVTTFIAVDGPPPGTDGPDTWRFMGKSDDRDQDRDHDDRIGKDRADPRPFWEFNLELRRLPSGTYNYIINLNDGTSIPFSFTVDRKH